jgi:hypothetical protein
MSVADVASSIESPEVWTELRRELDDVGISPVVAEERRDFIINWLKDAAAAGMLDENARLVGIDDASMSSRSFMPADDEGMSYRSITPTNDEGISSRCLTPTNDAEPDSSWYPSVGPRREVISLSATSNAFDAEVQRIRNERSVAELFAPLAVSATYSLPSASSSSAPSSQTARPAVQRRRTFGLVGKLFQKQIAIVQAASDGNIDRVARLISLGMSICCGSNFLTDGIIGMDVNAVDRWGWSALSMCGYGG